MEASGKSPNPPHQATAAGQQGGPDTKLHFLDYWRIIRIRKTVILAVFFIVLITAAIATILLPESYRSTVRIDVRKNAPDIAPLAGVSAPNPFDPYFIQTEFLKIKSKRVLHKVIHNLELLNKWSEDYGKGAPLKLSEGYIVLEKLVDVQQSRNTSLIEIRVYDKEPARAAEIANEIANVYATTRQEDQKEASRRGIEVLEKQLTDQNKMIDDHQLLIDQLRQDLKVTDAMVEGINSSSIEPETVRRMELMRTDAKAEEVGHAALLKALRQHEGDDLIGAVAAIPQLAQGSIIPTLLNDLAQTEQTLAGLLPDLGDDNPEIIRLKALRIEVRSQIQQQVRSAILGLEALAQSASDRADELEREVLAAKAKDVEAAIKYKPYYKAKRELEQLKRIRDAILLRKIQEEVDSSLPTESIVEITDVAEPGRRPVRPNIKINMALGFVLGLVLGVGLAFFIEYLDTSVKTIDDVERALQAPVVGVIPQNVGSLIDEGMDSPHAEAYRVLRTNVLFSRKDDNQRTITVVSGGAGEGKSTTIFNLATIFAQNGHRVLLVDSDLRRPSLHKIMGVTNSHGLTSYLLREKTLEQVIQTTEVSTMDFLPSGKLPSSSLGILNSVQMRTFIQEAKKRYDFVFFDSPPIMGVSDASILASEVDLAMLVVQYRKYPQAMTIRAKQMVEKVGGTLLGVVLNNINISQDSYYYYYSGYYYDYYSKNPEQDVDSDQDAKNNGQSDPAADRGRVDLKPKY